jgi:hypothetical protein
MKIKADELMVGDRFVCKVSVFEPNKIPGQKPGSKYYLRITSVERVEDKSYIQYNFSVEDAKFAEVPGLASSNEMYCDEDLSVLRK